MIELVITGGQTGADQAGWRAAKRFGIPTGGWMPKGYLTEDGPRPEFAELYGAKEHASQKYPPRTQFNVRDSDMILWFGDCFSPGGRLTLRYADDYHKWTTVVPKSESSWRMIASNMRQTKIKILNVAGNRESSSSGIGAWVEAYLSEVFRLVNWESPTNA